MRFLLATLTALFQLALPAFADTSDLWDLAALEQPVPFHWQQQKGPIHSLLYEGESYRGKKTEVFAFYASPSTLNPSASKPVAGYPAVVLIHGGGGTAFADWVYLWAKRGYAAIAMDLAGKRPQDPVWAGEGDQRAPQHLPKAEDRTALPNGGIDHGHPEKFDSISSPDKHDHWPFHAVANVIRAHTLIRGLAEVDENHTAVTGISWGGYTTCLVASVDHRFKAAVPVYGCGFLFEGESVQKPAIDKLGANRERWIELYDPSSHLANCRIPVLFVNGTNDVHYPLDSYQKSFDRVPDGQKLMRIQVKMGHGHPPGWAPKEIGLFIDTYCRDGEPLPQPGKPEIVNGEIKLAYASKHPIQKAQLHYTTDGGKRSERQWQSVEAVVTESGITVQAPPAEA
ncbi:MAG TPA: prolyl oligopeptidase family serine peptidase, partial [Bacteroidia bacterium]|nr:prolyl oligopeptidase family serine peptidase [Bacteroidia bacterium]